MLWPNQRKGYYGAMSSSSRLADGWPGTSVHVSQPVGKTQHCSQDCTSFLLSPFPQQFLGAARNTEHQGRALIFLFWLSFPCYFLFSSGQLIPLCLPISHLQNEVSKASFSQGLGVKYQCAKHSAWYTANTQPMSIPFFLHRNTFPMRMEVSRKFRWEILVFTLQRLFQECICFVHKRNISNPM